MGKEEKRHCCTYEGCTASFGRPYRLEQHLRVHTGEVNSFTIQFLFVFNFFKCTSAPFQM